jgi:hypothetical protein
MQLQQRISGAGNLLVNGFSCERVPNLPEREIIPGGLKNYAGCQLQQLSMTVE